MSARRKPSPFLRIETRIAAEERAARHGCGLPLAKGRQIGAGYVYVAEFYSGLIKVGRSTRPVRRLAFHDERASVYLDGISRYWVSARHLGFERTERRLIAFCESSGTPTGGVEYFLGVSAERAREAALEAMRDGSGGDSSVNAVEAWRRGSGGAIP